MYFEFEKKSDNSLSTKIRYVSMGVITLILLAGLSLRSIIPSIEKDLLTRVSQSLLENNIDNVLVSVSGRDITLEGLVSEAEQNEIIQLATTIKGVRKVNARFTSSTMKKKKSKPINNSKTKG